jgi:hypothetical protein
VNDQCSRSLKAIAQLQAPAAGSITIRRTMPETTERVSQLGSANRLSVAPAQEG